MSGKQNLLLAAALVGGAGLLLAHLAGSLSRSANVIRIGHDSKETSPLHRALSLFERQVEAESDGELRVEIYPARQLGGVRETTELVRQGNLQMTAGASVLLTSIVPEFNALDMFYLFRDARHAHRALDDAAIGGVLLQAMASKGLHGLGFMEVGFRSVTSDKRAVEKFADLAGLKIRAAGNPAQIAAWKSVGAAPTPLSWGEIFTSLQQGLINTQESAVYSIYAERFYEAQRYLSLTEHIYTNYVWFANRDFWEGLDEASQTVLRRAANNAITEQRRMAAAQNRDIVAELERQGMRVNRVDAATRAQMRQRMNGAVRDILRDRTGPELFDEILERIENL